MIIKSAIILFYIFASIAADVSIDPQPTYPILPTTPVIPTSNSPISTTTSKPTTSTSTEKPTTSTTPNPTPITTPTPPPDNNLTINDYIGNYTDSKDICFMAKMAIQFEILKEKNSSFVNVTKNDSYKVTCQKNITELIVQWNTTTINNTVSFEFLKVNSTYELHEIKATLYFDDNTNVTYFHKSPEFNIPDKLSYYCARDQALSLTNGSSNVTLAKVHLTSLQYQAFMNSTNAQYASVWDCDGANTSDVVPVVVGCVLAILVVLLLVVYLFGRRRCQTRGYLSMFTEEKNDSDYIPMKTLSCFK
ncbi:hypothetical protein ABEB36_002830 [Hypothenemus hampei]|uniref:Lysosome-associated membrane glycoprotein 5 n=1 Tax=Hypothenemus hampei TaxID=57062 RepID=A0ABD1F751_HYPHA